MKNKILLIVGIFFLVALIAWFMLFVFLPQTYWSPSWQYGLREQERHRIARESKDLSTDELIARIESNRDWKDFTGRKKDEKYLAFEEAINALGSRTDGKALSKLKEIILSFPEGQKCTAAFAISKSNNKAMVPVLCEALKRHTLNYTDEVMIKALIKIDDPRALDCFIQEKDKVLSKKSREAIETATEKWKGTAIGR